MAGEAKPSVSGAARSDAVEQAVASFVEQCRRGERPDVSEYVARHPGHERELRDVLSALLLVEEVADERSPSRGGTSPEKPLHRLGDYTILREVGRGGMGIVYEAVQESLGRRVALKLLPAHAMLDERHVERFRREARAVAVLHHTNIVPVFGVGEEEGTHFYAMQFIQGQPLDKVLQEVRRLKASIGAALPGDAEPRTVDSFESSAGWLLASAENLPEPRLAVASAGPACREAGAVAAFAPSGSSAALLGSPGDAVRRAAAHGAYYYNAASVCLQVAEALAYAHDQGVLHRDIKPSNLILDAQGRTWMTDFGLAKARGGEELTHTGDVVGTLAYMAPERFKGWSDGRSDIYSLGATLYECLTLTPAYRDTDRARLVRKVTCEEPLAPRKIDSRIPRDLETIVLKALEKEPGRRYVTAGELARDLRAFLEDKPIAARRASAAERGWRWCRRNPALALMAAAMALVVLVAVPWALLLHAQRDAAVTEKEFAVRAEREGSYWRSLAEAGARRRAGKPGQRVGSLEALERASASLSGLNLSPDQDAARRLALRNEAIACMTLDDVFEAKTWRGNPEGTTCIALDPRFERYARGDEGGNVAVMDIDGNREVVRANGTGGRVLRLVFSPDGKLLLLERREGTGSELKLLDLSTGEPVLELGGLLSYPKDSLKASGFSQDGSLFAAGIPGSIIRVHKLLPPRASWDLHGDPPGTPGALCFHPRGDRLAVAGAVGMGADLTVFVRDIEGGGVMKRIEYEDRVRGLAWHPDGRFLATAVGSQVLVTDVESGATQAICNGHQSAATDVAFGPEGNILASVGWDARLRLWDPWTGRLRFSMFSLCPNLCFGLRDDDLGYTQHGADVSCLQLTLSLEHRTFRGPQKPGLGLRWGHASPDGRLVVTSDHETVRFWDLYRAREVGSLEQAEVQSALFHPGGRALLTSGPGGVQRWPLHTAREDHMVVLQVGPPQTFPLADGGTIGDAALSADGKTLVVIHDAHLHAVDTESGAERRIEGRHDLARWIDLTPDGAWAATSAWNSHVVKVWDVRGGRSHHELKFLRGCIIAFSPDGRWLVVTDGTRYALHDTQDWRERRSIAREQEDLTSPIAFTPDGRLLAAPSMSGIVRLVEVDTGREVATLEPPNPALLQWLRFTASSRHLVAGTSENSMQIWDLAAIRSRLRVMGLDWDLPAPPQVLAPAGPLRVEFVTEK